MKTTVLSDRITALDIAGYATELTVWRIVRFVAQGMTASASSNSETAAVTLENIEIHGEAFSLVAGTPCVTVANAVPQLGVCIYQLIAGTLPFGGLGLEGQTSQSPLPTFSEARASLALSRLMQRCLTTDASRRPAADEIEAVATGEIARLERETASIDALRYKKPQNHNIRMKTYKFWPEAMALIALIIMFALPHNLAAQTDAEMEKLVRLTTTMRSQSKRSAVLTELKNDPKWTLMDELAVSKGECRRGDKVKMFGVNDIAAEIAQREKAVVNSGGRFRHSADGKHPYSFVEVTAKPGATISYTVKGHRGTQQIAVVPFDAKQSYTVSTTADGRRATPSSVKGGVSYISTKVGKNGTYSFEIKNQGKSNASFVVITHNSGK